MTRDFTSKELGVGESGGMCHWLFVSHPIPMCIYDGETQDIQAVNDAMVDKYGHTREEFLELSVLDLYPPAEMGRPPLLQSGKCKHKLKNGEIIDVVLTLCEPGSGGSKAKLLMAQDVTRSRPAGGTSFENAALRESEERYHALFDRIMDGIYRSSHDGKFVEINPALVKMFGYENREELLAVDIKKDLYFAPEERGSHILDTGRVETEVYRMRRRDGSEIWVEDHGYYVHDENGNIIYHEGMLRDVTERRRAEQILHRQFATLNSLYEMTAILSQTSVIEEVYDTALDGLQKTLATERVSILLFDSDGVMRFKAWRGLSEEYRRVVEGHSPWPRGIGDPQPVLVPDVHEFPALASLLPLLLKEGIEALAFIPLVHQGRLLGKFMIYYAAPHVFTPEEVQLAQTISHHVSFAISRKQAEEELRYANRSLELAHSELQQMFAHEQLLARTDGLTGLTNRRHFFELAGRDFAASLRYGRPLTIILFDVDGFKKANDTFGHAMGDKILSQIAQAAASQVRDVDVLARYGGDEFIVLLPQTSVQAAYQVAERIRVRVASTLVESEEGPLAVTLSLGVAEMIHVPRPDVSVEDAIRRADQALYAAKAQGNNRTVIFQTQSDL